MCGDRVGCHPLHVEIWHAGRQIAGHERSARSSPVWPRPPAERGNRIGYLEALLAAEMEERESRAITRPARHCRRRHPDASPTGNDDASDLRYARVGVGRLAVRRTLHRPSPCRTRRCAPTTTFSRPARCRRSADRGRAVAVAGRRPVSCRGEDDQIAVLARGSPHWSR